jgi:hypothetical protein
MCEAEGTSSAFSKFLRREARSLGLDAGRFIAVEAAAAAAAASSAAGSVVGVAWSRSM